MVGLTADTILAWFLTLFLVMHLAIGWVQPRRQRRTKVGPEPPRQVVVGTPIEPGQEPPPGSVVVGSMAWTVVPSGVDLER